ncbi:MAG: ribonuclease H-like domain-containing protein [Burkholderiales bacterium]
MGTLLDDLTALVAIEEPTAPRILVVDIETSPNLCYTWGLWKQNVSLSQLIEPSRMLCFAAKWVGEKRIQYFSEHHDGVEVMVQAAWDLYDEADIIVTFNGVQFDNTHLRREWLLAGFGPPSPWVDCDLLLEVKRRFKFQSNKLAHVVEQMGLPPKIETGGQSLWNAVMAGDPKAWEKFKKYNRNDVAITEAVYLFLRPWLKEPHAGLWTGDMACCCHCGSTDMHFSGLVRYKSLAYPSVTCASCATVNKLMRNGQTRYA